MPIQRVYREKLMSGLATAFTAILAALKADEGGEARWWHRDSQHWPFSITAHAILLNSHWIARVVGWECGEPYQSPMRPPPLIETLGSSALTWRSAVMLCLKEGWTPRESVSGIYAMRGQVGKNWVTDLFDGLGGVCQVRSHGLVDLDSIVCGDLRHCQTRRMATMWDSRLILGGWEARSSSGM